ncbi:hypothetical protein C0989_000491 [Termitomyces sp. Mn162]|nr:hypothetical protein C0989_000491 [Termitomyces sp. Mn162]
MLREEQSPMSSKAETSATLIPSSLSSSSELLASLESSLSEDKLITSNQNNPEKRSLGAYCQLTAPANQKIMSATLAFNPEAEDKCPLAEVKITNLKECPMLTKSHMENYLFQQWSIVCHQYQKHSGKKPMEVVAYIADGMIDAMMLNEYLKGFQKFALPHNWQTKVRDTILGSYQEGALFADWAMVVQNLNAHLKNMGSKHTLSDLLLKAHFESHMCLDLHQKMDAKKLKLPQLTNWIAEVTELDEELVEDRAQTQAMINASNMERSNKHKPLVKRISEQPSHVTSALLTTSGTNTPRLKLTKLMDNEKKLLSEHQGCTRC